VVGVPRLVHPSLRCVVELRVEGRGKAPSVGSGYLVERGWVLTAAHVVSETTTVRAWVNPQVALRVEDEVRVDIDRIRCAPGDLDWALVPLVDYEPPEGFVPVVFATLDRASAESVPVTALGLPWFKLREPLRPYGQEVEPLPDGLVREVAAVAGSTLPMGNEKTGTFAVTISGAPDTAAQPHAQNPANAEGSRHDAAGDPGELRSVWAGMSGAAVWTTGQLVGVIATHHPTEGAGTLTIHGVPNLGGTGEQVAAEATVGRDESVNARAWWSVLPNLSRPEPITSPAERVAATYQRVARRLAPAMLAGRGEELAQLDGFATSTERWRWYIAKAFAGKTALLAWWAAHHQLPDTVVVGCFLRRTARQNTAKDVVNTLSVQLGAIAGRPQPELWQLQQLPVDAASLSTLEQLLATAAKHCRRLVIVIDGLDEYAKDQVPVADWLPEPQTLPGNAALLVTSREGAPDDIPDPHPLRGQQRQLKPSPVAARLRQLAEQEIKGALQDPNRLDHRILAFLAAAEGPLTFSDLAALIQPQSPEVYESDVRQVWEQNLARTITPDPGGHGYGFSHDVLRETACRRFADELADRRTHLHAWAQYYAERGWPITDTPQYLLGGYPTLLASLGETACLAALPSPDRTLLLRRRTGYDAAAIGEITLALDQLATQSRPDLWRVCQLAVHRAQLLEPTSRFSAEIAAGYAALGNVERADHLAHAISDPAERARAKFLVADAVIQANVESGSWDLAEACARALDSQYRAWALDTLISRAAQEGAWGVAEDIAGGLGDQRSLPSLARLALLAAAQNDEMDRTVRLVDVVAAHASSSTSDGAEAHVFAAQACARAAAWDRAEALTGRLSVQNGRPRALELMAREALAAREPDRASRLLSAAESGAAKIKNRYSRAETLAEVATTAANAGDWEQAERLLGLIPDEALHTKVLAEIALVAEQADLESRAAGLFDAAAATADSIGDAFQRMQAFGLVAVAAARGRFTDRTQRLLDAAEDATRRESVKEFRASLLAHFVTLSSAAGAWERAAPIALAISDRESRRRALKDVLTAASRTPASERAAESIALNARPPSLQSEALAFLGLAAARDGDLDRAARLLGAAEAIARRFGQRRWRANALSAVARAAADGGGWREIQEVALGIETPGARASALAAVAQGAARDGAWDTAEDLVGAVRESRGRAHAAALVAQVAGQATNLELTARFRGLTQIGLNKIADPRQRTQILTLLVTSAAESGDTAESHRLLDEAEDAASQIGDSGWQGQEMASVARAATLVGDRYRALRVLSVAESTARVIGWTGIKNEPLMTVAEAAAYAAAWRQVDNVVDSIGDPVWRARAQAHVACAAAHGRDSNRSATFLGSAEASARRPRDMRRRMRALAAVAQASVQTQDLERARRLVDELATKATSLSAVTDLGWISTQIATIRVLAEPEKAEWAIAQALKGPLTPDLLGLTVSLDVAMAPRIASLLIGEDND
jgi:hypothetical protein